MDFDIVIIGAGLTGLSAARAILERGAFSVAIIEGKGIGSNDPSPLTFMEVVKEHRLFDCINEKYSSFTFNNFNGSSVSYLFSNYMLVVLDYKKACTKLFRRLGKAGNNLQYIDHHATGIEPSPNGVKVILGNGDYISTKLLIDASGKAQFTAPQFRRRKASYYSHVYGAFFTDVKDIDKKICCYLLPNQKLGSGGGWFYSAGKNSASFGYAQITDSPKTDTETLQSIFRMAKDKFKPYSDYLRCAKIDHVEKGVIPISYIDKFVYENIIIAGDAAGMATNWTCMGIEPALEYGKLAGMLSTKAILKNNFDILNEFQSIWDNDNKTSFDLAARQLSKFWFSDHYFWEWIIKNDLAFLTPQQVIDRLRKNEHLLKKRQIVVRALRYKMKSIINKNIDSNQTYFIRE